MMNRIAPLTLIFVTWQGAALGADAAHRASQFHTAPRQAGQVVLSHPGGEFIYGATQNDRAWSKAFTVGKREEFRDSPLSAQEESAISLPMPSEVQEKAETGLPPKKTILPRQRLDWPKVVLMGEEVCVPVLSKSESKDWRSHLTCVEVKP